jgi:hypothetical protein
VPGHSWLSKVSPRWNLPIPAIIVSLIISALICLINIGSYVALQAITSFGALATLLSYYLTIATFVGYRLRNDKLPARRWSLGSFGMVGVLNPETRDSMELTLSNTDHQRVRAGIPDATYLLHHVATESTCHS